MKKKLFPIIGVFSIITSGSFHAQQYHVMTIQSGYNADVIANGIGYPSETTTHDIDGANYAFVSKDLQFTSSDAALTYGLPASGYISSAVASTPGMGYQLGSYDGNNCLRLPNSNNSGTLVFSGSTSAHILYMLATAGDGAATVNVEVNFSDSTTQSFSGVAISDWYGGNNYAIQGVGRANIDIDYLESGDGVNPRLYQIPLAINLASQSKTIQSVTVTKTESDGVANVLLLQPLKMKSCLLMN